jgi:hypothetical protein
MHEHRGPWFAHWRRRSLRALLDPAMFAALEAAGVFGDET